MVGVDRRASLKALAACAAAFGMPVARAAKLPRIGMMSLHWPGQPDGLVASVRKALAARGWVEGRQYEIEARHASYELERVPVLAAELVKALPAVILTTGTRLTRALASLTTTIPIVTHVGDPVGIGVARSLGAPGGNVTGLSSGYPEIARKQIEYVRQIFPRETQVAILIWGNDPESRYATGVVEAAARQNGLTPHTFTSHAGSEVPALLGDLRQRGFRIAFAEGNAPPSMDHLATARLAIEHGIAIFGPVSFVKFGGLLGLQASRDVAARFADIVLKVLPGTPLAMIPFELPTQFHLVVNLKTASALKLTVPQELLLRADSVIQ